MAITKTKAATQCHFKAVTSDPEFIEALNALSDRPDRTAMIAKLLSQYGLEHDDFDLNDNGFALFANPYTLFSAGFLEYDSERREFKVRFNSSITKEQFADLWKLIQKNKKKIGLVLTKLKPPDDSKLLYAIFKARKRRLTFPDIFRLYQAGELPYYKDNVKNQYSNEDSFERYYQKYYKGDG